MGFPPQELMQVETVDEFKAGSAQFTDGLDEGLGRACLGELLRKGGF